MEKIAHANLIEKSKYYLDMSESLLNKIDLFLCNTDLTEKQKDTFMKLLEESYSEGYVNSISD
jgi:hypothetical protein